MAIDDMKPQIIQGNWRFLLGAAILGFSMAAHAGGTASSPYCGELKNGFGPYDYRSSADRVNLEVVERHHFGPSVEALKAGMTSHIGGDIDYTLRAFPNHFRALSAMSKLAIRERTQKPHGANYTVECYFERALRFRPNDGLVYMIYGDYMARLGQDAKAIELLKRSIELEPDNATVYYNLGLLFVSKKDYDQAQFYGYKAYELGYPLPGLKRQLTEAGKWMPPAAFPSKELKEERRPESESTGAGAAVSDDKQTRSAIKIGGS